MSGLAHERKMCEEETDTGGVDEDHSVKGALSFQTIRQNLTPMPALRT